MFIEWNGPDNGLGDITGWERLPEPLGEIASREEAVGSITDPVRTIVAADGWKLNCSPLGEHELYCLEEDRGETRNLIREPGLRGRVRELHERILAWQDQVEDPVDLSKCRFP